MTDLGAQVEVRKHDPYMVSINANSCLSINIIIFAILTHLLLQWYPEIYYYHNVILYIANRSRWKTFVDAECYCCVAKKLIAQRSLTITNRSVKTMKLFHRKQFAICSSRNNKMIQVL